jgi:hypothetical protein
MEDLEQTSDLTSINEVKTLSFSVRGTSLQFALIL